MLACRQKAGFLFRVPSPKGPNIQPQTGEAKRRRPHRRPVCGMDVGLAKQLTSPGFYANIVYCLIMKKSALLGRSPSFRHVEHYRPNYQGVNNVNDKKQDQTY